jgi:hypothetical protein
MNTKHSTIVAQASDQGLANGAWPHSDQFRRAAATVLALGVALSLTVGQFTLAVRPAAASGPADVRSLYDLVQSGQGDAAVRLLADTAMEVGGWAPAPGDEVVYDPTMARNVRGAVRTIDLPPGECAIPRLSRNLTECHADLRSGENLVRLGRAAFATPRAGDDSAPRPVLDDLFSTYIEEVGHSWQEYLYETEGRGQGERTRLTSWEEGLLWMQGREYQVKMYILSLDGSLLRLSGEEREWLHHDICDDEGYANPLHHRVPAYGPPPGWPNPDGWPVAAPTPDALAAFCATASR